MTDDRSERLRKRRKESRERHRGSTRHNGSGAEDRDPPTADDEGTASSGEASTSESETGSVKEEQTGTYMYLPKSQAKKLRRVYNILKAEYEFEFDEEFEKNRHFYPLVVEYGLEHLEGMDASEIREHLRTLGR